MKITALILGIMLCCVQAFSQYTVTREGVKSVKDIPTYNRNKQIICHKAIGIRIGTSLDVSLQLQSKKGFFIEMNLGTQSFSFDSGDFSTMFNFIIASPNLRKGNLEIYLGPGVNFGINKHYYYAFGNKGLHYKTDLYIGLKASLGVSYTFDFPLQLSLDYKPTLISYGFISKKSKPDWLNFGIGVRYVFGRKR